MGQIKSRFRLFILAAFVTGLSACSQSRLGLGGRFETAYMLNAVDLCRNMSGQQLGCFSIEVSLNDNFAYLDIVGVQASVARERFRILARASSGGYEELKVINGDDVQGNAFRAIPGSYVVVAPNGGRNITEYSEWIIETITMENTGTGLVRLPAPPGQGIRVVHDSVYYQDLEAVLAELGWNNY